MASKAKAQLFLQRLKDKYPHAHCQLNYTNAYELLIATILSAQCTDERVNSVTSVLFSHYPRVEDLAKASLPDVEAIIRPTGFFRMKAKNITLCCQKIVSQFQGLVPKDLDSLVQLPGVGRKTANVVLGNVYGIISGIVVDTHVLRLSKRLGWTRQKTAEKVELDLQKLIPLTDWILVSHLLIWHGRSTCRARKPLCEQCILIDLCPRVGVK